MGCKVAKAPFLSDSWYDDKDWQFIETARDTSGASYTT